MYRSNGSTYSVKGMVAQGRHVVAEAEDALLLSGLGSDRVEVLGHRGAPLAGTAENSVAAVREALRQGADGVEVDVRLSADGVLVCSHEEFVTTGTGARLDVAASQSQELLDGSGRNALDTLADVLAAAQRPVGCRVVVEVKPVSDLAVADRTARALADVLRAAAGSARVTVSSFDPALLAVIRATCADLPVRTALLGHSSVPVAAVVQRAHEDGHDEAHLPLVGVRQTPQAVQTARSLGLTVALWTVNRRRDLRWAAELGVDAVITDDVASARRNLDRVAVPVPVSAATAVASAC